MSKPAWLRIQACSSRAALTSLISSAPAAACGSAGESEASLGFLSGGANASREVTEQALRVRATDFFFPTAGERGSVGEKRRTPKPGSSFSGLGCGVRWWWGLLARWHEGFL